MKFADISTSCRASNDWGPLVQSVPYARFLNLRIDIKGEEFTCILPFHQKLIGNPVLPALHGGATGGFMECAGMFYLLWQIDTQTLPKTIDFNIDFLRTGLARDTYANVVMVKQGRRVANLRIEAWQSSPDKPIALGHCNFMLGA
ncbi:MAG: PaaI family thioesterase [Betaproteobacteria bacterium]|nr:PaaI family thioesterase [Betaproteobacteria bacterium]